MFTFISIKNVQIYLSNIYFLVWLLLIYKNLFNFSYRVQLIIICFSFHHKQLRSKILDAYFVFEGRRQGVCYMCIMFKIYVLCMCLICETCQLFFWVWFFIKWFSFLLLFYITKMSSFNFISVFFFSFICCYCCWYIKIKCYVELSIKRLHL